MALVGVAALALRLAVVPIVPVPQVVYPDEFSHLLFAETLASGRFTNPTPPGWKNIEALFVLYEPTYQSKYPIGQALTLLLGRLFFGHPWFGVWLTFGLMCAAICWMLQGWLSPPWALLGALLVVLRLGVFSDWINTYMGGALTALGGALTLGALPRLGRKPEWRQSAVLGLGIAIVMHIRPFESVMFCALAGISLWVLLARRWPVGARVRAYLPAGAVIALSLAAVGFHNWKVTGHPFTLPYQLHKKIQGTPQGMYWQAEVPRPELRFKRIADMYDWQKQEHSKGATLAGYVTQLGDKWRRVYNFYLGHPWLLPLACAALMWRNTRVKLLGLMLILTFFWSSAYGYFYDYYIAAITGVCVTLCVLGLRSLARWRLRAAPLGAFLAFAVVLSSVQTTPYHLRRAIRHPESLEGRRFREEPRAPVEQQLRSLGGRHIVFVRSSRGLRTPAAWYYNGPEVEPSPVIWAQELSPAEDRRFVNTYKDRRLWVLDADAPAPVIRPYELPAE